MYCVHVRVVVYVYKFVGLEDERKDPLFFKEGEFTFGK